MGIFDDFVLKNGEIVDSGFVKWVHQNIPDEEGKERETKRGNLKKMGHCKPCTSLSGCYFAKCNLPSDVEAEVMHPNCDCEIENVSKKGVRAVCPVSKFSGYIFTDPIKSKGKMALFEMFGYTIDDSETLAKEYERQATEKYKSGDYKLRRISPDYGQNIDISIDLVAPNGRNVNFISAWRVHTLGLITCNTPLGDK